MNENNDKKQGQEKDKNGAFAFLKKPPVWFAFLVFVLTLFFCTGAITLVVISYTGVISYILYAFSGLFLAYFIYLLICFTPNFIKAMKAFLKKNNFLKGVMEDENLSSFLFAVISFIINAGFIVFYTVCAILYGVPWYGGLAGYYFLLGVLRGGILFGEYRAQKRAQGDIDDYAVYQLKNYRLCGILLFVLEIAMTSLVGIMLFFQNPTAYTEVIAIAMATYTFYKIIMSILNVFKAKKNKNYYVQAIRNIGLVEATMSLFSLQILLISTFSKGEGLFLLNALVGTLVCLFALGMGIVMIVLANVRLKRLQTTRNENTMIEEHYEQNG